VLDQKDAMRLFVIGANGFIGASLLRAAEREFSVFGTSSQARAGMLRLDLNEPTQFDYGRFEAGDVICLTAAISAPDICSREHARAWAVNVSGTSTFVAQALARRAKVIFFSSDTVYGEAAAPIDERAPANPAGEYAAMKAEVERRFLGHPDFKAIRLSYVFSVDDKFTRYLRACAERGEVAEVFDPFVRSVIHCDDVVEGVIAVARDWESAAAPVLNFGGPAPVSRVEFANLVRSVALPALAVRIVEPGTEFFASRPRVINMESPILSKVLGRSLTSLCDAIAREFHKEN
jgi:dTDP-4-dehydrorhamnose reductase